MKYWLDSEFHEEQHSLELISIGVVAEDEREYYAESSDYDRSRAHPWLKENVIPHLLPRSKAKPRNRIAAEILGFCDPKEYGTPEFWGYYADYDWVVFCWLFGAMIDLPEGFPMYCRDIKQWADMVGNPELPKQQGAEHNALADARHHRTMWEFLEGYQGVI